MSHFYDSGKGFDRRFKGVLHEIDFLEDKIYRKKGIVFVSHRFSENELLDSKEMKKVYAITQQTGSEAELWFKRGQLSEKEQASYHRGRGKVGDRLHQVKRKIYSREPTWWEELLGSMEKVIVMVMDNLPKLKHFLLEMNKVAKFLPVSIREKKMVRLLTGKKAL